jgi:YidC/Oxa1 family membrane protein insertase
MEKRTVLAFVLMALVLVVSQYLFVPREPPPEVERGAEADSARPAERPDSAPGAPPGRGGGEGPARPAAAPSYVAPGGGSVRVETPLYTAVLDRRGGVVTAFYLKRYPSYVDSLPVQLVPPGQAYFQRAIRIGQREVDLTRLTFEASRDSLRVAKGAESLALVAALPAGGEVRQTYRFEADNYLIGYRLDARGPAGEGELVTRLGPLLRSTEKSFKEDMGSFAAVARVAGEVHTLKPGDVADEPARFPGATSWVGIKSKYFLSVLLSGGEPFERVTVSAVPDDSVPGLDVSVVVPLEAGSASYRLYMGPQEFRGLTAVGAGLEDVNQYGWSWIRWAIRPFAHLILRILLWMHEYVPNYGVVLIIFGVLVRLIMWPLTQKSFESMRRMQAVQPELQRLRERYKNDAQKMQQEMMRLYRERGVNPFGGCLPNLLPLPILFALFFVFQNTIELRGAPFVAWIQDLSRPDPYFVLPILMGVTMFVQQKLMTPPDNPQMKMMTYFMPPFLTFIFLNLASGLVLYYTVSNLLTFVQQFWMKRGSSGGAAAPGVAT